MADYYPLISRAVAGLEKNNGENRRALYERARAALLAQLRNERGARTLVERAAAIAGVLLEAGDGAGNQRVVVGHGS